MADENAQRLCTIFSETAWDCLLTLRDMISGHDSARFDDLYEAGLSCVRGWNSEVVREEVLKFQSTYPETSTLFKYVYVLLLKEVGDDFDLATQRMPNLEECYHLFLCRVCSSSDVKRGASFFSQPLLQRKALYIECFRNAMHDVLRRRTLGRAASSLLEVEQVKNLQEMPPLLPLENSETAAAAVHDSDCQDDVIDAIDADVSSSSVRESSHKSTEEPRIVGVSRSPCFFEDEDVASASNPHRSSSS